MKYDPEIALAKATDLFWQKGYKGTTMRDLQDELDMRPGSIYAGLGNKTAIYTSALTRYTEQALATLEEQVASCESPMGALREFVEHDMLALGSKTQLRMCFAVKTLNELESDSPLAKMASEGLKRVENAFAEQFERARLLGEIDQKEDSRKLGRWLQVQITGLRCLARLEQDPDTLRTMVDDVFDRVRVSNTAPDQTVQT